MQTTPDEVVYQIGKTTDVSSKIWEQALKFLALELQTAQLKSKRNKNYKEVGIKLKRGRIRGKCVAPQRFYRNLGNFG